jgi:hypothetical protein
MGFGRKIGVQGGLDSIFIFSLRFGGEKEGFFFFQSGWVGAFKYFILVVGAVGDTWIYPKFCIFSIGSCFRF